MNLPRSLALAFASSAAGLFGCGSDPAPAPVDSGAVDAGVDVPVALDIPMVDSGTSLMLTATLSGRQAVPPAYTTTASGTVMLTLNPDRTLLGYTITHTILLPTETRLYIGLAGEAGTTMVSLMNHGGTTIGTVGVTADQARAIVEGRAYINVASMAFPDGELRGQIVQPGEEVFSARLSTDQENPPTQLTSSGVAELLVNRTTNRMRFAVRTTGMATAPSLSHIHTGAAGSNGGVLVDLAEPGVPLTAEFRGERTVTAASLADLDAGRWYVNVHSAAFPGGEIRGQILRPGERLYIARMTGLEEVPPAVTTATGVLGVIVGANRDMITYAGSVTGLTPTASHLHAGELGMSGAVVTPLTLMGTDLRGTASIMADGDAGAPLLTGLAAGAIYANVHSAMYPNGEIRGQLRPAPATP